MAAAPSAPLGPTPRRKGHIGPTRPVAPDGSRNGTSAHPDQQPRRCCTTDRPRAANTHPTAILINAHGKPPAGDTMSVMDLVREVSPETRSASEHELWESFPYGTEVDLTSSEDPTVRASVIRALLCGGRDPESGHVAAVRLRGARRSAHVALSWLGQRHDPPAALVVEHPRVAPACLPYPDHAGRSGFSRGHCHKLFDRSLPGHTFPMASTCGTVPQRLRRVSRPRRPPDRHQCDSG